MDYEVINGDCVEELSKLEDNSVDSIVTDPPYGLGFMGKKWDALPPSVEVFHECLRVLKPGGHLLAFGGSRTYHRLAVAVEDAGFEIRDQIQWVYGGGFPKSQDVSKAIDKAAGAKREIIGESARQWEGWGTALKPAHEPIVMARKPLDGTVVKNVQEWGTGAINIDGCRVPTYCESPRGAGKGSKNSNFGQVSSSKGNGGNQTPSQGRFPANLIHDGSDEVLELFPLRKTGGPGVRRKSRNPNIYGADDTSMPGELVHGYGDDGSAARFFYCSKANKKDRTEGGAVDNRHPTVKPTDLMRYLCRMVTPPGGTVLDPFMGSGSTGKAAVLEGFNFIGIEADADSVEVARKRIEANQGDE